MIKHFDIYIYIYQNLYPKSRKVKVHGSLNIILILKKNLSFFSHSPNIYLKHYLNDLYLLSFS
jgi:hypothetical protein